MYGEVALGYKNANTPEELYGIREYESVADIEDFNSQSKNAIPAQKDPAFPKVTSEEGIKQLQILEPDIFTVKETEDG